MISSDIGVARIYYSGTVPADGVAIASVSTSDVKPSDLCSIDTSVIGQAALTVVALNGTGTTVTAPALMQPAQFTGATAYQIDNQFFELTITTDTNGAPLFYQHKFRSTNVSSAVIVDLENQPVTTSILIQNNVLYHSLDGAPYWVQYYVNGQLQSELLHYDATLTRTLFVPGANSYTLSVGGGLSVINSSTHYWIRFVANNGYQVLPPYNVPLNDPWYPRIRFNLKPVAQEWGVMPFTPQRPYMPATWVPGRVLATKLLEFERPDMYFDGETYPDVLIYDSEYRLKFALDGTAPNSPSVKGYLFPWMRAQFIDVDTRYSRVEVNVSLDPTDKCFASYNYRERDVVYGSLDVNPFTNPQIKDKVVQFYFATRTDAPFRNIFYIVQNQDGTNALHNGQLITNDPLPAGTKQVIGSLVMGWALAPEDFTFSDIRERGGGLDSEHQSIPQADHFWDLGYWDGRPYPTGGGMPVYLPNTVLNTMSKAEVKAKLEAIVPAGTLALIRYYDPETGEESL